MRASIVRQYWARRAAAVSVDGMTIDLDTCEWK